MPEFFKARVGTKRRDAPALDPDQRLAVGAAECLSAAKSLDAGEPDQTGEYIVLFHAIELGWKLSC